MKIEETNQEAVSKMTDDDLKALRLRFMQQWRKHFDANAVQKAGGFERADFLDRYAVVVAEIKKRGLSYRSVISELDRHLIRKAMLGGISVADLGDIMVSESCISVAGDIVATPHEATVVDFIVATPDSTVWKNAVGPVVAQSGRERGGVTIAPLGPAVEHVPLYDLVLRARLEGTRKAAIHEKAGFYVPDAPDEAEKDMAYVVTYLTEDGGGKEGQYKARADALASVADLASKGRLLEFRYSWVEVDGKTPIAESAKDRGDGMGQGGSRQGDGGTDFCECPECGKTVDHEKGVPCVETKCPKCGAAMVGANKASKTIEKRIGNFKIVRVSEEPDEQIVGGIVYGPDEVDAQDDWTDEAEITKAMHHFMEHGHKMRLMHSGGGRSDIVPLESFQAEVDTVKGGSEVRKGAWYMTARVTNSKLWAEIRAGNLTGWSLGGVAQEASSEGEG